MTYVLNTKCHLNFFSIHFFLNPVMREWPRGPRQLYFVPSLRKQFGQCMPALLCGRLHRLYYADVFCFRIWNVDRYLLKLELWAAIGECLFEFWIRAR